MIDAAITDASPHRFLTPGRIFWAVVFAAAAFKLILSITTVGTNDVLFYQAYASKIQTEGALALYRDGIVLLRTNGAPPHPEGFAHPPFIIHLMSLLTWTGALTGASFPFLFRLPSILADIGSAVLVRKILAESSGVRHPLLTSCLFAGAPLLIFLSGFHGNTDPIMVFFLILSVWLLPQRRFAWLAGLAFGMSCSIKIFPLLLVPTLLLYIPSMKDRLWFSGAALAAFVAGALPVAAEDPVLVVSRMLGYVSLFGQWGVSRIVLFTGPATVADFYRDYGRYLMMLAAVAAGIWMQWKTRASLFLRVGLVSALFLVLTPGFGIQYLSWMLPWVTLLGSEVLLVYLITTGVFMVHVYSFWSNGLSWNVADSTLVGPWDGFMIWYEILCWLSVLVCFALFVREVQRQRLSSAERSGRQVLGAVSDAAGMRSRRRTNSMRAIRQGRG